MRSDRDTIAAAWSALEAAFDTVAGLSHDVLTHRELLTVLDRVEALSRRLPTVERPVLSRLMAEASPVALGARNLREVLRIRLRISGAEARRRLAETTQLGPRTTITGQPMPPELAHTAAAQAGAHVNREHVVIIRNTLTKLPGWVDGPTRDAVEADLVGHASGLDVDAFDKVAKHLLTVLDPDGAAPDDADRARKRGFTLHRQGTDGMSRVEGWWDPQARATWEAIFAKFAAPGTCNPEDPTPCVSGTPSQSQIQADTRSLAQRQHDALTAIGRQALSTGDLGQHNGLPVTVIVSTTLRELESAAGSAVTAGGTVLPMSDVIRLASHAHHYLRIYDSHTSQELYLGRTKRCASPSQRIVLHARDRGCTAPGCTVPGYGTQVHHVVGWARHDGRTDVDQEVLACGPHNRMAEAGWTVVIEGGVVKWIPPPQLESGQARTNAYHHPDRVLRDRVNDDDSSPGGGIRGDPGAA